jgi:hypothetical protein
MTSGDWSSINPYQTPVEAPLPQTNESQDEGRRGKLTAFRQQIHAVGGAWIVFGILLLPAASGISVGNLTGRTIDGKVVAGNPALLVVGNALGLLALVWIVAGVATCLKHVWAVYTGLIINYVVLAGLVLTLPQAVCNIVFVVIFVFVILQAHRVLRWSREFTAAGIPLNAKL